ncbi:acyl-[acyl-carrier-protein] thioesterase [Nocardia sp. 2]|uniref:Acyl-[acyl-carrier-protein] thioesterase n=1 Tax=Nocardia acididurans TaxID=2802282 RepID=A0ABS1MHJ8_9NOCA|nr:acyl-[acyl-carrier-protein] thioesterase [Nocardia acididurans]
MGRGARRGACGRLAVAWATIAGFGSRPWGREQEEGDRVSVAGREVGELERIANPLPPCPESPEPFQASRTVRLGDTDIEENLRLDAIARYAMDLGYDNLGAVPEGDLHPAWIVRRTVIDVRQPIRFSERVHMRRWPSGLSNRWCNIRCEFRSDSGGLIETEQFLINIDLEAGRMARMSEPFMDSMRPFTTEHRLRWRAALREIMEPTAERTPYPLRITDIDRHGHVNNAVHWAAVAEGMALHQNSSTAPYRVILEHAGPIMSGDKVTLRSWTGDSGLHVQLEVDGTARTLALIEPLR